MIQVIHRALNILEFVARHPDEEVSLTEIAEVSDLNLATCANIVKTLVTRDYLEQVSRKKGYRLGPMAYYLTDNMGYMGDIVMAARHPMEELTAAVNESTILAVLRSFKRLTIYQVEADRDLHVRNKREKDIYQTSTGRLLLAYLSESEREAYTKIIGLPSAEIWPEATTPAALEEVCAGIRKERLAHQETTGHVVGIAVPIQRGDRVLASLGMYMPYVRFEGERGKSLTAALRKTADLITDALTNPEPVPEEAPQQA